MPPPTFKEFDFETLHEVVGFGRILPPLGLTSNEYGVEVHFAEVLSTATYALGSTLKTHRVGCGQIGWTPLGSRWKAKVFAGQRVKRRNYMAKLHYVKTVTLADRQPKASGIGLARDMTCYFCRADTVGGGPQWVLLPVAEVIRVLFGVSSAFLVQLFGGLRNPEIAPDSAFYDRAASTPLPLGASFQLAKSFRLAVTREPSDMEAIMAAWVLSDPGMLRAHDSVDRCRDRTTDSQGAAAIDMDPPTPAMAGAWTFEYAPVDCEEGALPTNLVTRILAMPLLPFFETLEITHHHLAERGKGPPTRARIRVPPPQSIPRLQERTPAGSGRAPVEATMDGALLEPAHAIEIVRMLGPAGGPPPPLVLMGEDAREEEKGGSSQDGSTGDRQPGGGASFVVGRRRRDLLAPAEGSDSRTASRRATWLAAVDIALALRWAVIHGGVDEDDEPFLEKVFAGRRSFPLVVVCLRTAECDVFVVDAGTEETGGLSLGLLARVDRARFDAGRDLPAVLGFAARTGARWGTTTKALPGFVVVPVNRVPSGVWKKRTEYRDLVWAGLSDLLLRLGVVIPAAPP